MKTDRETTVKLTGTFRDLDAERDELWDWLMETGTATDDEMSLVTSINGYSLDTLESILYSRTGYRSLAQIKEMEEDY